MPACTSSETYMHVYQVPDYYVEDSSIRRTLMACVNCRMKKQKCGGTEGTVCARCEAGNRDCIYLPVRDAPPRPPQVRTRSKSSRMQRPPSPTPDATSPGGYCLITPFTPEPSPAPSSPAPGTPTFGYIEPVMIRALPPLPENLNCYELHEPTLSGDLQLGETYYSYGDTYESSSYLHEHALSSTPQYPPGAHPFRLWKISDEAAFYNEDGTYVRDSSSGQSTPTSARSSYSSAAASPISPTAQEDSDRWSSSSAEYGVSYHSDNGWPSSVKTEDQDWSGGHTSWSSSSVYGEQWGNGVYDHLASY